MRRIAGWVNHTDIVDFNCETSTLIAVCVGPDPDSDPRTTCRSATAARKRF